MHCFGFRTTACGQCQYGLCVFVLCLSICMQVLHVIPSLSVSITQTSTVTQTVEAPTPTSYAQCASNNVIGSANGNQGIYQPGYAGYNGVAINQVATTDPTQCCVTCAQASGCVGYSQYPGGPCYFFTVNPSVCDGSNTFGDLYFTRQSIAAGSDYIIGNGQCG